MFFERSQVDFKIEFVEALLLGGGQNLPFGEEVVPLRQQATALLAELFEPFLQPVGREFFPDLPPTRDLV